jgi:uncharacterized protein with PIN domain
MGRIGKAYEAKFRALLARAGARRLEQGLQWLDARAGRLSAGEAIPLSKALARVCGNLAAKLPSRDPPSRLVPPRFFCDAGLGGLARWLRGAGYEAFWRPGIEDSELVREALETKMIILTTDSLLMERRLLRDGVLPGLWLPPVLTIQEQLELVFLEFRLAVRQPRCMSCGGELQPAAKTALHERIPPRTYRWLDEYFLCRRCGKLFWHGTHWERIQRRLGEAARGCGD